MTRRLARRGDDGAALILVLIVVTVVAVGLGALLSLADTSIRTTVSMRGQAVASADADGALQAAITNIRNSDYRATAGSHCFGGSDTLTLPNFHGSGSATVQCTADPATVLIQCPALSQCNRPGSAILTLGRIAGEDGISIKQPNTSTFNVHGGIFSNSNINVVNGTLRTNSSLYARGNCAGPIQSTPAAACSYTAPNPLGDDPGYLPAVSTVPTYRTLPACNTANSVVTFLPGYYDDAAGLSQMMDGNSHCKHSTWWFKPGTYYFDFHNTGTNSNPLLDAGSGNVWTVNDGYLVAGTPVDPSGHVLATPQVPAAIPGACNNPISDPAAVGVQFIFGGDSQLAMRAGKAEICGSYSATKPPVAVYGLTTGSDSTTALTGGSALQLTGVTAAGGFAPTATTANLATADGTKYATWKSNNNNNDSTTVTVSGFAPPTAIPAGSVFKSAALRVVHRHSDTIKSDSLSATVTPPGGSSINATLAGHPGSAAWQTDQVALDSAATGAIAQAVHDGTFTGSQIAVTATLSTKNDIEDIDAIQLDLTYVAPALRAGSGCVTNGPYTGGSVSSCALISTTTSPNNQFYIQGTTYAPKAVLDITLNNAAEQVFRFGLIARSLWIKETGSFSYSGPVIEVPDDAPGFGMALYLTAYVCPDTATCPVSGAGALRAKVAVMDANPTAPTPGRRQIAILSWASPG
jgi:Tfp pilus assembly protein PilX